MQPAAPSTLADVLVMTDGDRRRVAAMIDDLGEDAVRAAARARGERPYPSAVARALGLAAVRPGGARDAASGVAWLAFISDGLRLGVRMKYDPEHTQWWKQALDDCGLPRAFHRESKSWVIPSPALDRMLDALGDHAAVFPADMAREHAAQALGSAQPFIAPTLGVRLSRLPQGSGVVLESAYDAELVRVIRQTGAGSWVSASKAWVLDLSVQRVLEVLEEAMIFRDMVALSEDLLEFVDVAGDDGVESFVHVGPSAEIVPGPDAQAGGDHGALLAVPPAMRAQAVSESAIRAAAVEHALLPHQVDGVRHCLKYSSALLADDMGLGKTRQAIVVCIIDGSATLILCPATLKANWRDEIVARGIPAEDVQVLGDGARVDPARRWWIANFEIAERLAGLPYVNMVVDEAHYLKEPTAQRTREAFRLSAKAKRVLLLTATPILNREAELWTLLRLGGHELGRLELNEFRELYTGSAEARHELSGRIGEWMLRRMKTSEVVPGKMRFEPKVSLDDAARRDYRALWNDGDLTPLDKLGRLRHALERAKVPFILDALRGLQQADKAIVFCERLDVVQRFMDELGTSAVRLTGAESMRGRRAAERAFQDDPSVRFFVTTFKAGGVGLNLTAAKYVFMAARPWTPAEMEQAEDRANRIGQKSVVQVIVPTVEDTIDEQFIDLLGAKKAIMGDIVRGKGV